MDDLKRSRRLADVSRQRTLGEDLRRIWSRRHFLWFSAVSELRAEEVDTVLGNVWHVINPTLQMLIYYLIFGLILQTNRGVDNFFPFVAIGVFSFQHMKRIVVKGSKSLVANRGLIRSISFPLATLPIAVAISEVVGFVFPTIVMLTVAIAFHEPPTWAWLAIFPIFVLQTMFALGLGFVAARINYYVRDFGNALDFLFRMTFYFSGVIFLVERFVRQPTARHIVDFNPFFDFLSLQRWAIMGWEVNRTQVFAAFGWATIGLTLGYLFFRAREQDYGRER